MSTSGLMKGKRGLVMGVANDRSIAWGITEALHNAGAEMAFTYQGDAFRKRVLPLVTPLNPAAVIDCDVSNQGSLDALFAELKTKWDTLDFVVHAIAYSDKDQLKGRYVDTSPENFRMTMDISCYSFTAVAQRAEKMMPNGGSMVTLSYYGAEKVTPHYNVMGVAKAALEASVRYIAEDLGKRAIRVNADLGRADQDPGGVGRRRLPLYPQVERAQFAAAPQRHDAGSGQRRPVPALRSRQRRHRRMHACRCRLSRRRHEGRGRARHQRLQIGPFMRRTATPSRSPSSRSICAVGLWPQAASPASLKRSRNRAPPARPRRPHRSRKCHRAAEDCSPRRARSRRRGPKSRPRSSPR